jgi:DNA-binding MarR family transcriptional regulator
MHQKHSVEERFVRALRQINRAIDLHSRALLNQHGLTGPQLAALREIERMQPVSTGVLAHEIQLGAATLTGILDRLEERGLIRRTRHEHDRRSVLLALTEEGQRLFASAPSQLSDRFRRRLAELPEWEQTQILSTLQRIAGMMDAPPAPSAAAPGPRLHDAGGPGAAQLAAGDADCGFAQSSPSTPSA